MFSKLIPVVLIAAAMSYAQNSDDFSTAIASTIVATPATGVVGSFYTTTFDSSLYAYPTVTASAGSGNSAPASYEFGPIVQRRDRDAAVALGVLFAVTLIGMLVFAGLWYRLKRQAKSPGEDRRWMMRNEGWANGESAHMISPAPASARVSMVPPYSEKDRQSAIAGSSEGEKKGHFAEV